MPQIILVNDINLINNLLDTLTFPVLQTPSHNTTKEIIFAYL